MSGSNMSDLQSLETSRLLFHIDVNWSVFAGKESQRDWNEQEVGYIYDAGTGILLIRASQFLSTIAWFFVCPVTRKWASREIWKATFEWFTASGYSVPGCHTWTYLCQLSLNIFLIIKRQQLSPYVLWTCLFNGTQLYVTHMIMKWVKVIRYLRYVSIEVFNSSTFPIWSRNQSDMKTSFYMYVYNWLDMLLNLSLSGQRV